MESNTDCNGYAATDDARITPQPAAASWARERERTTAPPSFMWLFQRNWHATIAYCAVFWSFGMCVAVVGPTLLDLGCITSTGMQTISWVFLAQLMCSLIGSITAGLLASR